MPAYRVPHRLLIAVGGNATHPGTIRGTPKEQLAIAERTAAALLPIMTMDNELIVTHGNGPVVGKILMRQALARHRVPPMSMDICVAHSQGGIAYLLMQALENSLRRAGNSRHVVCFLTQVEVDPDDEAFASPSKPVGFFFEEQEAMEVNRAFGWLMHEEGDRGWRYVVPSPRPKHIVDISLIEAVAKSGAVVIAGGGGGIPVIREPNGERHGVNAVIDKDLTSAKMANVLDIELLMILTEVNAVSVDYGKATERALGEISLSELKTLHGEGQFADGSMGPKVGAVISFLENGGRRAVIGHLYEAEAALLGHAGTQVLAERA